MTNRRLYTAVAYFYKQSNNGSTYIQVTTSGKAGGLNKPWKGILQATPLKGLRKVLPTALLLRATPKGVFNLAYFVLLPVNGSIYS